MSAEMLKVEMHCRSCRTLLTLAEMHEYADDDGTAACDDCLTNWARSMVDYMRGDGPLLEQP